MSISDVAVGLYALVMYRYPRSEKYYIGECTRIDESTGEVYFLYLQCVHDSVFKYRENVVEEVSLSENILSIVEFPEKSRRGATLNFKSSSRVLSDVDKSLLY